MNFNRLKTTGTTVVKTTQLHEFFLILFFFHFGLVLWYKKGTGDSYIF